jgi:ATP-dependent RNA helicase RhlE
MTFEDLKLDGVLHRAVLAQGYTIPTPIQAQAIPHALAGKDVLGCAQTGTGKTAAFALPILQRLAGPRKTGIRSVRCLVLTPTRELASQIADSFTTYGRETGLRCAVVFGGVSYRTQTQTLQRGVDILIATPGRLLDLIHQRAVSFDALEVLVLDEADRMLDMGFILPVKRILNVLPRKRQTLFFSATMPAEIQSLANSMLSNPVRVEVTPVATTAETIDQRLYHVHREDKRGLLLHVLKDAAIAKALVFTRTKNGANRVARHLCAAGITADAIHGDKSQSARERALASFRGGQLRILVATDIAARGIDIDGVTHVINFEIPNVPESYVHRIGRTGRAGATGTALSFCDSEERAFVRDIERTIRRRVPVMGDHPYQARSAAATVASPVTRNDRRPDARPSQAHPRRTADFRRGADRKHRGSGPRPASSAPNRPSAAPGPGRRYSKWD